MTYLIAVVSHRGEEKQVAQKETEAELQVDGSTNIPQGVAQEEGEDGRKEAQQRDAQPHVCEYVQGVTIL